MSKLADLGQILNGAPVPKNKGKYPAFGGNGIISYVDKYNYKSNTVVIGRVGANCGDVSFSDKECWVTDNALALIVNEQNDPYFVYNLLKVLKLNTFHIGSSQPLITQRIINNIECNYIKDINHQKRIGSFFSNIDKKIQNNKKQIETLESIAKTIYDYWFVQFDFPNEDGKPYKSSGGKMVWNEALKMEIPELWNLGCLHDIADITMGQSPCGNSYNQENRGVVFFQGCSNFGYRFPEDYFYTSEPTRIAKENDILMSVRAPVGTLNMVLKECCIGRGLAALRHKQNAQSYLYYLLNTFKPRFDILDSNGTTFGALTKDVLFKLKVVIPTSQVVKKFELLAVNLDEKIKIIERENRLLHNVEKYILPLLMNGQVSLN